MVLHLVTFCGEALPFTFSLVRGKTQVPLKKNTGSNWRHHFNMSKVSSSNVELPRQTAASVAAFSKTKESILLGGGGKLSPVYCIVLSCFLGSPLGFYAVKACFRKFRVQSNPALDRQGWLGQRQIQHWFGEDEASVQQGTFTPLPSGKF